MMTETLAVSETLQFIRCRAAGETYCLDMKWVESIERTDRLRESHHTEGGEAGLIGWLSGVGDGVPVYGLAARLGQREETADELRRIVVLNSGKKSWGLMVESVSQVTNVNRASVAPLPAIARDPAKNFFGGVIETDDSLALLLAPERIGPDAPNKPDAELASGYAVDERDRLSPRPQQRTDIAAPSNISSSPGRILVFSLAEPAPNERALVFGLSVTQVPEVLNPLPVISVPGAPVYVQGIVRWRGLPVPVIDLAARLGLPPVSAQGQTRLMISCGTRKNSLLGFFIRPMVRSLQLPVIHRPSLRDVELEYALIKGLVELENETLVIPDIQRLLGRIEAQC